MPPRCESCDAPLPLRGDRLYVRRGNARVTLCKNCASPSPRHTTIPGTDGCESCRSVVKFPYHYCYRCYQHLGHPHKYLEQTRLREHFKHKG